VWGIIVTRRTPARFFRLDGVTGGGESSPWLKHDLGHLMIRPIAAGGPHELLPL